MILDENLFENIEKNLNEAYSARWDNMVTYSNPIKQQYADLVNDQIYDALDNIDVLASSKISDLPEQTDFGFDQAERVSKAISNLVRTMTREYFLFTDLKDESLKESIEYIKWVQLPDGKWKIWGSNNGPELDPSFLDRAKKQNDVEYKDAKVSKNGEYPEGVSEEDIYEEHRFTTESLNEDKIADKIIANQDTKDMTKRAIRMLKNLGGDYEDLAKEFKDAYGEDPLDDDKQLEKYNDKKFFALVRYTPGSAEEGIYADMFDVFDIRKFDSEKDANEYWKASLDEKDFHVRESSPEEYKEFIEYMN